MALDAVRVLVAEDNVLTRLGIVTMLEAESWIQIVGQADDGVAAVELFRKEKPDVLVTDLKMPKLDGVQLTRMVCQENPDARVLVLTHLDDEEDIFQALKAGARGYMTKDGIQGSELVVAVKTIHDGGRYLPAEIAARLADRMEQPELNARERQIIEKLSHGLTNQEIGESLSLNPRTARAYVSRILEKLGARSRTEAVSIALDRGILKRGRS